MRLYVTLTFTRSRLYRSGRYFAGILLGILVLNHCTGWTAAQTASEDPVGELRTKTELTADELATLDNFIESLIKDYESERSDPKASNRLQVRLLALYKHPENSPRFAQRVAERSALRMGFRLKSAEGATALTLIYGLSSLPDVGTLAGLKQALDSPDEAVRSVALRAVRNLRSKFEVDPALLSDVIRWLQDVGVREKSTFALSRLYLAIDFSSKADEQTAAFIAILETRLQNHPSGKMEAELSELAAFHRLETLSNSMNEVDKKRVVGILARYLTSYTYRYLYRDIGSSGRANLHRLVLMVEKVLTTLTGLAPEQGGVTGALASIGSQRPARIRSALEWWVGSKDKSGVLNAAPWQVPVGSGTNVDFAAPVPEYADEPFAEP